MGHCKAENVTRHTKVLIKLLNWENNDALFRYALPPHISQIHEHVWA